LNIDESVAIGTTIYANIDKNIYFDVELKNEKVQQNEGFSFFSSLFEGFYNFFSKFKFF